MGAERIDVLAVMDSSVGTIEGLAEALLSVKVWEAVEPALAAATRLHNVRHAVAELIEADKAFDAAKAHRIEADNRITLGDRSDDAFRRQANAHHAYDRATARRRAALARIGGAS